jgi:hypothetical protein
MLELLLFSAESFVFQFSIQKCKASKIYRTVVSLLLYVGGLRLRVFKNKVLWKIFGPKRDNVTVQWRRLHNEELYDL